GGTEDRNRRRQAGQGRRQLTGGARVFEDARPLPGGVGGGGAPGGVSNQALRQGAGAAPVRSAGDVAVPAGTAGVGAEAARQGGGADQERLHAPRLGQRGVPHGGLGPGRPRLPEVRRGGGGVPGR